MLTSHPQNARYFLTRREAQAARAGDERVCRLGTFSSGSFGLFVMPRVRRDGSVIPPRSNLIIVWMVA